MVERTVLGITRAELRCKDFAGRHSAVSFLFEGLVSAPQGFFVCQNARAICSQQVKPRWSTAVYTDKGTSTVIESNKYWRIETIRDARIA
ncbi:hypothetical protein [Rhodanobacter sp. C01]|uniref:hypothetical protein n=1 Tax=Rhodanobacter sp. C01 TaxID=1945856 RepID=UPI0011154CE3|nr:hypothetical protein [Rhodanobacter sp. C01]